MNRLRRRTGRGRVPGSQPPFSNPRPADKKKAPRKRTPLAEKQPVKLLHAVIVWHQQCHRRNARVKEHVTNCISEAARRILVNVSVAEENVTGLDMDTFGIT